jgi:ABC-type uncharacterized transport system involved in gliding motility auxiliary subunit
MTVLLLLISIVLSVAGIVFVTITGQWTLNSITLLVIGAIFFLFWLVIKLRNRSNFGRQTSIKATIESIVKTILFFSIITSINFFVISHSLRIDLTENQIFTLTPQSQAIAANLKQPLKVWIFNRNITPETQTLLQNYQRYSNNFSYQIIPKLNTIAQQFSVSSLGDVYLQYGTKKQKLDTVVTLGTNITEAQLTNAIAEIQQDRTSYIYFLQGHGEPALNATEGGYSQAISALTKQNYLVKPLNLTITPQIPKNADLIAIAKPMGQLLPSEIKTLQQYLQNGGNLLLMLMPNTDIGLNPILQEWGIQLDNRLVIDATATRNRPPTVVLVNRYGKHPITDRFDDGIALFPQSRIVKTTEKADITATPIVITNKNTWAESNLAGESITFNPQEDIAGPLNIAIALTKENSRMVIFGSAIFATDDWFTQQLNGDLFLNTVDWLTGADRDNLSIPPKQFTNRRIDLTSLQASIISWLAIVIFPLLGFILAGITWWRKRRAT